MLGTIVDLYGKPLEEITAHVSGLVLSFRTIPVVRTWDWGYSIVEVIGDWDPGKAQTVTATALAANPDFAGVWCQGGTDGVVRAFLDAGVPLVPVAGEAENGFRKQML